MLQNTRFERLEGLAVITAIAVIGRKRLAELARDQAMFRLSNPQPEPWLSRDYIPRRDIQMYVRRATPILEAYEL